MAAFIPDKQAQNSDALAVPFFEESKDEDIPGRGTTKTVERLMAEAIDMLERLGARSVRWDRGKFPGKPLRHGFLIQFQFEGVPGQIECAALPLRSETAHKRDRAQAQALYLLHNWLEAEVHSRIYRPGSIPLLPYLTPDSDGVTITKMIVKKQILPISSRHYLPSGGDA